MMIKLWMESTVFEKIRVILFICLLFVLFLAYLFPSAFIRAEASASIKECKDFNSKFSGKFIIINGEAIPICDMD